MTKEGPKNDKLIVRPGQRRPAIPPGRVLKSRLDRRSGEQRNSPSREEKEGE